MLHEILFILWSFNDSGSETRRGASLQTVTSPEKQTRHRARLYICSLKKTESIAVCFSWRQKGWLPTGGL